LDKEISGTSSGEINSETVDQSLFPSGDSFQIKTTMTGRASIRSMRVTAEQSPIRSTGQSVLKDQECQEASCDDISDRFSYQF
jgi:hypothetical protein